MNDANGDGTVNLIDLAAVKAGNGTALSDATANLDVNADGAIDLIDAQYRADAHYNLGTTLLVGDKIDEARGAGADEVGRTERQAANGADMLLELRSD